MGDKKDRRIKRLVRRNKEQVVTRRLNWDICFYDDIANNDGFIITEPSTITLDGKVNKTMYGPNSPLFGTTYGDEQAFLERHRCKCGAFKGKQFEGEICPLCNTKIEARETDIKLTGWMTLGNNVVINPYWYKIFLRLIGKKVFPEIISGMERVDTDGIRHRLVPGVDYEALSPYSGIGIDGFLEKYDEILDYFEKKKKDKKKEFDKCRKEKAKVFTHHIPVYSTMLRPSSATSDTFYYNGIDKQINPLFNLTQSIKDCEPIEKDYLQQRIQMRVNLMWDFNFDLIDKKEGFIRNKLIAGALNYTSRCVIVPDPTLRVDEVDLPYQAFRILFKYRIIYYIMKIDDIPLSKAFYRWRDAYKFDEYVYDIMMHIVNTEQPRILLNRNPTLNYYSMLLLRIRKIQRNDKSATLAVPLSILPGLNADFDGDILNMIAMFEDEIIRMFRNFDPIEKYIISRTTGMLDDKFAITKGQLIDLYHFATFDESEPVEKVEDPDIFLPYVMEQKRKHEEMVYEKERKKWEVTIEFPKVVLPPLEEVE